MKKYYGVKGSADNNCVDPLRHNVHRHFKFSAVYDVQIQSEGEEFDVVSKIRGNDGENMREICRTNKECHLQVCGSKDTPLIIVSQRNPFRVS